MDRPEVLGGPVDEFLVDGEQVPAGVLVIGLEAGVGVQFGGDVERVLADDLVAAGLLGVGGEPVVLQGVAGEPGDVLDGEVEDGVFGDRGVAVVEDPFFVKVGGALLGDPLGNFVEGLGAPGGHGEDDGYLLLREVVVVEGVDSAGFGLLVGFGHCYLCFSVSDGFSSRCVGPGVPSVSSGYGVLTPEVSGFWVVSAFGGARVCGRLLCSG